jgi:ATP-dependent DNA helicase RecQ
MLTTGDYETARHWLQRMLGDQAEFRPGQWEAVEALVKQHERLLVVQRTGWGKSLVYFLATRLLRSQGAGATLLISPLLSLMRNQIQAAESLSLRAAMLTSANPDEHDTIEAELLAGKIDLLLISPERLANDHFQTSVWEQLKAHVGMVCVDEAHCISDWGHDFRPNYRRILYLLDQLPAETPILATTATANNRVIKDIQQILGANLRVMRGTLTRESLRLFIYQQPMSHAERLTQLVELLKRIDGSGIIYCATTNDCIRVSKWMQKQGFNVKPYFAEVEDRTGENRIDLEQQLLNNRVKALAASVALGMGFDKPDLSFVIHYQSPGSIISYYQQIGRAGRGIERAYVLLMHGKDDEDIQRYFIETAFPQREHVEAVIAVLEQNALTRNQLLAQVNVRPTTLDKILLHLELERIVIRDQRHYRLLADNLAPDYARWQSVSDQRYRELAQMTAYTQQSGCLMRFISAALDDPMPLATCGKCQNCRNRPAKPVFNPQFIAEAEAFLMNGERITIEPRKQYPSDLPHVKGRIKQPNETGIALCLYHDAGYGEMVRTGKYRDNHFSDVLVEASAGLLCGWFAEVDDPPHWIANVPSLRHPTLVADFARRLAGALGLTYYPAIINTEARPEQKTMQNSHQQVTNLAEAFALAGEIPPEPVLLVDDMLDSGWTLTILGDLLRKGGCQRVYPFALAKVHLQV